VALADPVYQRRVATALADAMLRFLVGERPTAEAS
jgi:hypothetical protein